MNKYRNTVTGVVITTPCTCAGENWEPVKGKKKAQPEKEPEQEQVPAAEEEKPEPEQGGIEIGPAPTGAAESNE